MRSIIFVNFYVLKSGINKLSSTIKFFRGMAVVYDPDCVYVRALKLFLSDEPDSYERLRTLTFSLLEKEGFDCGEHVEGKLHKVRESIKKCHRLFFPFYFVQKSIGFGREDLFCFGPQCFL